MPYNSKAYLDAKVSMTNHGTVDAGRQMQSPASAGSRGLAKTTQFTNNKTQMQLGQEAIAESMVDIRNIMNRIDGINVPTNEMNELADDDKMEFTKTLLDISAIKDRIERLSVDDDAKASAIQSLTNAEEALVALDETAVQEKEFNPNDERDEAPREGDVVNHKDLGKVSVVKVTGSDQMGQPAEYMVQAKLSYDELMGDVDLGKFESAVQEDLDYRSDDILNKAGFDPMKAKEYMAVFNDHGDTSDIDQMNMDKVGLADAMSMVLASHGIQNESTTEDSGELSRLKELSGLEEDNGKKTVWYTITPGSEKEKGMMQAEIDQGGKITNILAATPEDIANQLMKLGVTHDDYDFGHTSDVDFPEEDEGWNNKEYGNDAHGFIQDTHEILKAKSESYQPFPEADEFNIEEDEDFEEVLGPLGFPEDETELFDAEYQGRKVPLNKPMRGDSKKFKVYVKDPKTGNVKKVNFGHGGTSAKKLGQKTMKIRKSNPKARKSFRARHNCANPGPKTKARYWSCRAW